MSIQLRTTVRTAMIGMTVLQAWKHTAQFNNQLSREYAGDYACELEEACEEEPGGTVIHSGVLGRILGLHRINTETPIERTHLDVTIRAIAGGLTICDEGFDYAKFKDCILRARPIRG